MVGKSVWGPTVGIFQGLEHVGGKSALGPTVGTSQGCIPLQTQVTHCSGKLCHLPFVHYILVGFCVAGSAHNLGPDHVAYSSVLFCSEFVCFFGESVIHPLEGLVI